MRVGEPEMDEMKLLQEFRAAVAPPDDAVLARARARMLRQRLAGALAALSATDRDALLLVADGLSYQEAARALGVPPGTLSSRAARARRHVRVALGGVNPADES